MSLSTTIDAMITAGCTPEQIGAVVRAHEAKAEARKAEKRALAAKRQAAYRERHPKSNASDALRASSCVSERHIASNARAPARGEVLTSLDSKQELSKERPPKGGPKKGSRSQISPEAQPDEQDRAAAQRAGMSEKTLENEWQKFRDRNVAKAEAMADWHAAWRTWIGNWRGYGARQVATGPPQRSGLTGFAAVLDHLEGRTNEPTNHPMRDITPGAADTDRSHDPTDLFEPAGRVSRVGEVVDFCAARADVGGQAVAFGPSWRASG